MATSHLIKKALPPSHINLLFQVIADSMAAFGGRGRKGNFGEQLYMPMCPALLSPQSQEACGKGTRRRKQRRQNHTRTRGQFVRKDFNWKEPDRCQQAKHPNGREQQRYIWKMTRVLSQSVFCSDCNVIHSIGRAQSVQKKSHSTHNLTQEHRFQWSYIHTGRL